MLLNWPKLESRFKSDFGSSFVIHSADPVAGGDINLAFHLITNQGPFFVKLNTPDRADMFATEREGLLELAKCSALRVPEPVSMGQTANAAYLCMEYLDLVEEFDQARLGAAVAELHQPIGQAFGWQSNNFIGSSVQHNGWGDDWADFFWERRLEPQIMKMIDASSSFPTSALNPLRQRVTNLLSDRSYEPSLVHGDLWHGNVGMTADGRVCLFDPAVYWGHSETDLAMARLFGGFSEEFFDAYDAARPQEAGYEVRRLIYQLYHLFNHFNLFGDSYLEQCTSHIGKILQA